MDKKEGRRGGGVTVNTGWVGTINCCLTVAQVVFVQTINFIENCIKARVDPYWSIYC